MSRFGERETLTREEKCVWIGKSICDVSNICKSIIGPYYFESSIATGETYKQLLTKCFFPTLPSLPPHTNFRKDDAPSHHAVAVEQFLDSSFANSWIGRGCRTPWKALSPDWTLFDCPSCGYAKNRVNQTPCPNLAQLKRRFISTIRSENENADILRRYGLTSSPG